MDQLSATIAVLTAMITPALLISASGTLILSTSTRLGRVVDRVRALSATLEEIIREGKDLTLYEDRVRMTFEQLDKLTSRSRLLQRAMVIFYVALGTFVLTSVAIGLAALMKGRYAAIPVATGILGTVMLLYGSILLIFEARLALYTVHAEMDFIWRFAKHLAPPELVDNYKDHQVHFRMLRKRRRPASS